MAPRVAVARKAIHSRQARSFFSLAAVLKDPPSTTTTPVQPSISSPSSGPHRPEDVRAHELYAEWNDRFLKKLPGKQSAQEVWDDYSRLVEGTMEKFNLSIVDHRYVEFYFYRIMLGLNNSFCQPAIQNAARHTSAEQ